MQRLQSNQVVLGFTVAVLVVMSVSGILFVANSRIKESPADIAASAPDSAISTTVGSPVTLTLGISNVDRDNAAREVALQYTLPAGFLLTGVDSAQHCDTVFHTLTCNMGAIAGGQAATVTLFGVASTPGTSAGVAWITSRNDVTVQNNTVTTILTVSPAQFLVATLALTPSVSPATVSEGDVLNYSLLIVNTSGAPARGVTLFDILPPQIGLVSVSPTPACNYEHRAVHCVLGDIGPGASTTVLITTVAGNASFPAGSAVNNTVFIASANPAPDSSVTSSAARIAPRLIPMDIYSLITKAAIGLLLIVLVLLLLLFVFTRLFFKHVPTGNAGIISRNGKQVWVNGEGDAFVWPFIERLELRDIRPKTFTYSVLGVTRDSVGVTFRICIDIQVEPANLLRVLQEDIKPERVVERLIDAEVAHDAGRFTYDQILSDLRHFTFHIENFVCLHPDGAQRYGIKTSTPRILSFEPAEVVKAAAEELKVAKIAEDAARVRNRTAVAQKISEAEARAARLKMLDEAIDRVTPRAVEYDVTISGAGKRADDKDAAKKSEH